MDRDTVNQWLAHGMASAGNQPALVFGDAALDYPGLDALGNRVARHLARHGVRRGDPVGICLDRSVEMVAVVLGILKAGAAYVPLDPAYPPERLAMMAEDARLRCAVAHAAHRGKIARIEAALLVWEEAEAAILAEPGDAPGTEVGPEDVAYIIFTSGSTGRPKGIAMPHRALANLVGWQLGRKGFKPGARVLQYSSISFDVSFQEIATTLASGGTLHLIADGERRDPRTLLSALVDHRIERLFLPYVALRSLVEAAHAMDAFPDSLKEVVTAGEQLRVDAAVRAFFSRIGGATLDNQYGPSETHVVTAHLLEGDPARWPDLPSIGTALRQCAAFVLGEDLHPVPAGEAGELYLAGRNLALGYVGNEEATRKAFVASPPHIPDFPVLYRTGDLASRNPDGTLAFLGRRDHQIKIRGHRIEPGEINNAAAGFAGVGQCLTHAVAGADGVLQLAAYYTAKPGERVDPAGLRSHLAQKLPGYMVPAFLVELERFPCTPSGKVDLKALPKPSIENSRFAGQEVRYETGTEESLARIWSGLLGLDGIPRTADFFELGGDSLRAATLFLKIQQQFGCDLPLATLLQFPTVEALARVVDEGACPAFAGCRSLKTIQKGADGIAPLFLVHGGAGNVLCFSPLARNLGAGQPVYAFQWSGWDGGRGESSIQEMARAYRDELLEAFPDTPVRIGGYCIGGFIAMELSRLLREAGVDVLDPLVVFDSPNLRSRAYHATSPAGRRGTDARFKRVCADLAQRRICADARPGPAPDASLPWFKRTLPYALARRVRTRWRLIRTDRAARSGQAIPFESRNWYCAETQKSAVRKHRCAGTDLPVLYFRSECHGPEMLLSGWWDTPCMGFDELCLGVFDAHIVGGSHDDILRRPEVADIIKKALP